MPSFCEFLSQCEKTRMGGFPGRRAADRGERILSNYIFRCLWHSERPVGMLHCPYRITSRIICSSKAFAWQQSSGWWLWPAVGIPSIWPGSAKWLQLGSLPQTIAIAIIQVSVGICPNRNIGRQRHSGGWWHTPAVGIRSIWPGSTKWLHLGSLPQTSRLQSPGFQLVGIRMKYLKNQLHIYFGLCFQFKVSPVVDMLFNCVSIQCACLSTWICASTTWIGLLSSVN